MNQKGFSQVILLGIVAVLVLIGVGGFLVLQKKKTSSSQEAMPQETSLQEEQTVAESSNARVVENAATPAKSLPHSTKLAEQPKPISQHPAEQKKSEATFFEEKTKSIKMPGYTELVSVFEGVAAALSRDDVLQVVDVKNPSAPAKIQTIDTPAFAEAAYKKDGYLYIADSRELRILGDDGKIVGIYNLENFWPSAVTVDSGFVYLASGNELLILDATNFTNIKRIYKATLTGRGPTYVAVENGYAFVIETLGGLNIVDVRNPNTPKTVRVIPFQSHTAGFKIKGNYAYLGRIISTKSTEQGYSQTSVFEVIDISNPALSSVVGAVEIPTNITGLDVDGNYAYVIGSFPYRLTPIDISHPDNPKILKTNESIVGSADLQDIAVQGGYAFIADGTFGLRIVDVSDFANPKYIKDLDLGGRTFNIHKSGGTLYLGVEQKYFNVADVSDPETPTRTYTEPFTASYKYTSVVFSNKKVYFNGGGARIYDISDPKSPRQIKIKPAEVDSIQIQGTHLYSTIGEIGLLVYDLSDPSSMVKISQTPFPVGIPRNLSVDGHWAVGISNSPYSINVFDISDPKKPIAKDSHIYEKYPNTVTVKDNYVYVARAEDGVDIFKIHPDGSLKLVKIIPVKGYAHAVVVYGKRAFVVRDGADIYDITDPANPLFLMHIDNKGEANSASVDSGYLYIADGYAGVTIVKIPE